MNTKTLLSFVIAITVYLLASGGAYFIFAKTSIGLKATGVATTYKPPSSQDGVMVFDPNLAKTQPCPLNGALYSKQQEAWWKQHRPLGVMIENHEDARPQSGLNSADVTYEAVAEGGITRTFNEFYCQDPGIVGPVRSARTYFVDFASEYGDHPLYAHVGGANTPGPANALGQIDDYGWGNYNDLNQFSIGYPVFWRDYNRLGHDAATEHTMYSTAEKLWDYAQKSRGLGVTSKNGTLWTDGFLPYTFKDDASSSTSQAVHLEFWSGYSAYFVDWKYDKASNSYFRSNGGKPHIDRDTNKQLTAKNIVILSMQESAANDGYEGNAHRIYGDKGTGKAVVFQDGKQIKATWSKKSRTSRTEISDANGNPIAFVRGHIWFEILPLDGVLTVK